MLTNYAEKVIRRAMAEGQFDDLPGRGKPLDVEEDWAVPADWRMAFRILKNAGHAPLWIEKDKEIRKELERARVELRMAWEFSGAKGVDWERAVHTFTRRMLRLNELLRQLNLSVPSARFQRAEFDLHEEIQKAMAE